MNTDERRAWQRGYAAGREAGNHCEQASGQRVQVDGKGRGTSWHRLPVLSFLPEYESAEAVWQEGYCRGYRIGLLDRFDNRNLIV